MKKINSILFAAILALVSGSTLAAGTNTCNYPKHFKVMGGKILDVEMIGSSNPEQTVVKTSDYSFDLFKQCAPWSGATATKVKVGLDGNHENETIFTTPDDKFYSVYATPLNNYVLDEINRVTATDYQLVYKVK